MSKSFVPFPPPGQPGGGWEPHDEDISPALAG